MAPRPFWKGYLKLSLVTCPVAMAPATSEHEKIRFHTLNRATGHRVVSRYVDQVTGAPVEDDDQARGYARGENDFVLLEDEELDAVALESTRTIDIEHFVPRDSIGWIFLDKPHFLTPNDAVGEEAFSVIRDAMKATRTGGIARLVLYRRERAVLLLPEGKGIIVWTLRYGDEVRPAEPPGKAPAIDKDERALFEKLIAARMIDWDPALVRDPVQERLGEIIAAKRKGRRKPAKPKPAEAPAGGNVISIMDALKKSLAAEGDGAKGKGARAKKR